MDSLRRRKNVNLKKYYIYKLNLKKDNWDAETGNGADALFASGAKLDHIIGLLKKY